MKELQVLKGKRHLSLAAILTKYKKTIVNIPTGKCEEIK